MPELEKAFENLLANFPNFVSAKLRPMPEGKWGDVNVHIRQGELPECHGRVDLAFVTDTMVYLVEVKKDVVDESTVDQIRRYYWSVEKRYPNHAVLAFIVGRKCRDRRALEGYIGGDPIAILTFGIDIPWYTKVVYCKACAAGASSDHDTCPYCGTCLF
jgi:hypothetical protein